MKKVIVLLLLCIGLQVRAQEFSLHLQYFVNGSATPNRTVVFGFDPTASDSLTDGVKWLSEEFAGGEQEYPSDPFGDIDCRWGGQVINRPYLGSGGPIDIRRKPTGDHFQLPYELDLRAIGASSVRIAWNKSLIPASINHIFMSSGVFPTRIRLDLKEQSEFILPVKDSSGLYDRMIFTILYNQDNLGVPAINSENSEIVISPSIIASTTPMTLWLNEDKTVAIKIMDVMGRKISETIMDVHSGSNTIPSTLLRTLIPGMYTVQIIEASTSTFLGYQKLIVR
jgi:hypothetical protein